MVTGDKKVFSPAIPPDIEHVRALREEALDWLSSERPDTVEFTSADILAMAGEKDRRWLVFRLRERGIGAGELFTLPETAAALTVLFLRSKGIKFSEAIAAVVEAIGSPIDHEPRFGGVLSRLIHVALRRIESGLPNRLLGAAVYALLPEPERRSNCMFIAKSVEPGGSGKAPGSTVRMSHDDVYRVILERPMPSCWVLTSTGDVQFLDSDQPPTRSEVTSRHFIGFEVHTASERYEAFLGTLGDVEIAPDERQLEFIGRVLDVIFLNVESFVEDQAARRFETAVMPGFGKTDNLQLWLITQLLGAIYPGSVIEISELGPEGADGRVLASSAVKPWEPMLWDPPKRFEMLSGYSARVGVPLVVETVKEPLASLIGSVGPEIRFLESGGASQQGRGGYSAVALPVTLATGRPAGALYILMPHIPKPRLNIEVRMLLIFARIIGEIIEQQRSETYTADISSDIATSTVLGHQQFRSSLLALLRRSAININRNGFERTDLRLPFLLLSAHGPDPENRDPGTLRQLRRWLVETLQNMEWRSFVRMHWPDNTVEFGPQSFMGELPDAGMVVALDTPLTKDELDHLRNSIGRINSAYPANSPVRLATWVLDVPAYRIAAAAEREKLQELADDIERWAMDVASIVDDVAQSRDLAHRDGEWEESLRRVRHALRKPAGRKNGYLYRLAAECSFAVGDWPSAAKYAKSAVEVSSQELGSGQVRALCQQADAHLCLVEPAKAWDLYTSAVDLAKTHPLPRYYRGYALIYIARLLRAYEYERLRQGIRSASQTENNDGVVETLLDVAMEDLTIAADLFEHWGLISVSRLQRDFHMVPTLFGEGMTYLLSSAPGPAASRLQTARRSFPQVDQFLREFMFAKSWEQGLHRRYSDLLVNGGWAELKSRLETASGRMV